MPAHQEAGSRTDAQLIGAFIAQRDEAAFEVMVRRHGPMVLGVCRRVLPNLHDAEDAFQATFLVLVRKAASIAPREMLGNWLHGVAYRTAMKVRVAAAKRKQKEQRARRPERVPAEEIWHDLQPLLDRELEGLPDHYRLPIVLCDLEGKTWKQAARQLGWPEGTLGTRLSRGRSLLARRLKRRGLGLSVALLTEALAQHSASACLPSSLLLITVKAASLFAIGEAAAGGFFHPGWPPLRKES
jgi:RNA polymerase sigma-70 factor (ECF subfamily)